MDRPTAWQSGRSSSDCGLRRSFRFLRSYAGRELLDVLIAGNVSPASNSSQTQPDYQAAWLCPPTISPMDGSGGGGGGGTAPGASGSLGRAHGKARMVAEPTVTSTGASAGGLLPAPDLLDAIVSAMLLARRHAGVQEHACAVLCMMLWEVRRPASRSPPPLLRPSALPPRRSPARRPAARRLSPTLFQLPPIRKPLKGQKRNHHYGFSFGISYFV